MRLVNRGWSVLALAIVWSSAIACSDRSTDPGPDQSGAGAGGASGGGSGGATGGTAGTAGQTAGAGGEGGTAGSTDAGETDGGDEQLDGGALDGGALIDASGGDADAAVDEAPDESCLAGISDFKAAGPFAYEAQTWDLVNAWIPDVPAGCRVPMVHLAVGTGATCMIYQGALEHLASHGFLALCYGSAQTGTGRQCLTAVETAEVNVPELISKKIGFAGHHVGGVNALMCAYRAKQAWGTDRLVASYAITPPHGNGTEGTDPPWTVAYASIDTPVFMFSTEGGLVSESWVGDAFDYLPATTEVYWYKAVGASDIPIAFEHIQGSIAAWFRWQLLGDRAACEYFKALPDGDDWDLRGATSPTECE